MINVTSTYLPPLEDYVAVLNRVWESRWLTNRGEVVQELEARLCEYLQVSNVLAVANGTIAIQLALRALGVSGEVLTTPFSYVATVSSIVWEGCTTKFVDIDPRYFTIDPEKIEDAITENTGAIVATHVYGNPCDVESIEAIAKTHSIPVIYDAAHCFGVTYKGRSILDWGDVSTLSFHATKLFHTGEGGGVVCADRDVRERLFHLHNFGHDGPEAFHGLGINGKISELHAAMGLAILPSIGKIIGRRKEIVERYLELLADTNVQPILIRPDTDWNCSYFPVLFPSEEVLRTVMAALNAAEVFPRRYFYPPLNRLPYVKNPQSCPVAEDVSSRILCLPLSDSLADSSVERICSVLKRALR